MKALTVQQPWAWAIVHGGKDIENRTQAWGYRGPLAIHAGARVSDRGMESPMVQAAARRVNPEQPAVYPFLDKVWRHEETIVMGAIIGVVDLVDAHYSIECCDLEGAMCSAWAEASYHEHGGRTRRDIVHLVLEHPRPLAEPIPCRGALGLWTPPAEVLQQLQAAIA